MGRIIVGHSVEGKVVCAQYRQNGAIRIDIELNEKDRKKYNLEKVTLKFSLPYVLPILVGDEIIVFISKPLDEPMSQEEKPFAIMKGLTSFEFPRN